METMKLFVISQTENCDYDTYDSAVVAAETEDVARNTNPSTGAQMTERDWSDMHAWCSSPDKVMVKFIGLATVGTERGLVLSSFNAG